MPPTRPPATASAPSPASSRRRAKRWPAKPTMSISPSPTSKPAGQPIMAASSAVRRSDAPSGRLYPWLFVGAMGLVILVNAAMIFFAVHSFTGLATQDPYDKGLAFNRTLAAARAQAGLGWQVDVAATASPADAAATVTLAAAFRDGAGRALDGLWVR